MRAKFQAGFSMRQRLALLMSAVLLGAGLSARALQGIGREEAPPKSGAGALVEWEGWSFRWSVRPREGLVLNEIGFRGRQVMKHAALAEIFVPYDPGQPRPEDSIDGMGINLQPLIPGKDCIPGTTCSMFDTKGRQQGERFVAMHEESTGLIYMGPAGRAYGKMLVLWCATRLGEYVYLVRWRFRDDGCLMPQIGLTGKLNHTGDKPLPGQGTLVQSNPAVWAPSHVHSFYFRLDLDVDGPANDRVEELNHTQDEPGKSESSHDAWTELPRETVRSGSGASFRSWRVVDSQSKNALGHPRSYEIIPSGGQGRGAANEAFAQGQLYALRYKPHEFPFSSVDGRPLKRSLPSYMTAETLTDSDVVLYYVMQDHHLPRSEDWPLMPVQLAGFTLMPRDFLDGSPLAAEK